MDIGVFDNNVDSIPGICRGRFFLCDYKFFPGEYVFLKKLVPECFWRPFWVDCGIDSLSKRHKGFVCSERHDEMNGGRNKSHRAGKEAIQLPNKAAYL